MSKLYLVTGGAGFIGSHIVQRLVKRGERVRVVDNLCTGEIERLASVLSVIDFVEEDLADPAVCDRVVDGVDYVLHQAAIPSVQRSIRDPMASNRANITATLNVLESCRTHGVRRLVYAASSSVYGDTKVLPKREDMPATPLSPYALQKFVGERYAKLYFDLYKLETVSLRYFNVFGPSQDPYSEYSAVIPKFITKLLAGEKLTIFGDGEQSRDFTYVENVVQANLLALTADGAAGKMMNLGCGTRISLNQLVKQLENILGLNAQVEYLPARAGDVRDSLADIGLAERLLGYQPRVSVEDGLARTVDWFRNHASR
ncbi:MAG: family oxidoreductase [Deltaproteobacteria bacterium]|nr:SDR family oxidoreductase [Deltaproteobacteria bacterium]MBM2802474.1 family oxidoreductase [Deltaproteobacteria bacterium]